MDDFEILAERKLLLRDKATGITEPIRIILGMPYWVEKDFSAACPVSVIGFVGRVNDIHGVDFLSAIQLSLSFVDTLLAGIPQEKELLWTDGESYP